MRGVPKSNEGCLRINLKYTLKSVSDDNGPPRSVTKMSVCGQSTMVVINETHQALDASADDIDASPFVSTTPSDDKIAS